MLDPAKYELLLDLMERLDTRLNEIDKTLSAQHVSLVEHIRRTEVNEEGLDELRKEIAPLKQHVALWGSLGKILTAIGSLLGIAAAALKFLGH